MANQRVLDNNEDDESTKGGASIQGSHTNDKLGHILEDTSLDEWDVISDDDLSVVVPDSAVPDSTVPDSAIPDSADPNSAVPDSAIPDSTVPYSAVPEVEPVAEKPRQDEPSSLFSFSLMQKFGSDSDTVIEQEPETAEARSQAIPSAPSAPSAPAIPSAPSAPPAPAIPSAPATAPLPSPPVATGPNPFLVQLSMPAMKPVEPVKGPDDLVATKIDTSNPSLNAPAPAAFIPAPSPSDFIPAPSPPGFIPAPAPPAFVPAPSPPAVVPAQPLPRPAPTPTQTPANTQGKRKPAATLIFDSFTKSKIGLDLLDPFNLPNKPQTSSASTGSVTSISDESSTKTQIEPAPAVTPKQRPTARTLIFKAGMSTEGLDLAYQPLPPSSPNPANPATTTDPSLTTHTPNSSSVGPNLAAAIAAANPLGQAPVTNTVPTDEHASRSNSNVIPAYKPVSSGRPIARTMILKSLAPPKQDDGEQKESTEPNSGAQDDPDILISHETIIAAGEAAEAEAEAESRSAGKPKFAKRSTAPTLIFKAFTLPSADETAKPTPLKIVRYDSSKLRNLETNVKPIGIAESIAAAKQATLTDDKNDRRPHWLKIVSANPLLKSQGFRSGALLIVLSTALLVCSTSLIKSLYSDGEDFHPTNITAARDQRHFRSTDGGKVLDLSEKGMTLINNGKVIHGKSKTVNDGDLVSLATAPESLVKREIWLQKTDAGYVDQDGTVLYGAGAPELVIAKKIETYANLVAAKYKETKLYPSDIERLERIAPKEFRYTNPFTGKVDQPTIQYKRFAAADAAWTDHTRAAHNWPDEPQWKPGAIHFVCLDYCRLFIRGFDRNGHALFGSAPGVADYVELKDGENMNPRRVDKPSEDKTQAVFLVSRNPGLQTEVSILRPLLPIIPVILALILLVVGGCVLFIRKMKNNNAGSTANTTKFLTK